MIKEKAKDILGTELQSCCTSPMTGFFVMDIGTPIKWIRELMWFVRS